MAKQQPKTARKRKPKAPKLPDFPEEQRNLVVLGVRSGLHLQTMLELANIPRETFDAWLYRGRETHSGDAAEFAAQFRRAQEDAARTPVLAAHQWREKARNDPSAARRFLREMETDRQLAEVKALTAGT